MTEFPALRDALVGAGGAPSPPAAPRASARAAPALAVRGRDRGVASCSRRPAGARARRRSRHGPIEQAFGRLRAPRSGGVRGLPARQTRADCTAGRPLPRRARRRVGRGCSGRRTAALRRAGARPGGEPGCAWSRSRRERMRAACARPHVGAIDDVDAAAGSATAVTRLFLPDGSRDLAFTLLRRDAGSAAACATTRRRARPGAVVAGRPGRRVRDAPRPAHRVASSSGAAADCPPALDPLPADAPRRPAGAR